MGKRARGRGRGRGLWLKLQIQGRLPAAALESMTEHSFAVKIDLGRMMLKRIRELDIAEEPGAQEHTEPDAQERTREQIDNDVGVTARDWLDRDLAHVKCSKCNVALEVDGVGELWTNTARRRWWYCEDRAEYRCAPCGDDAAAENLAYQRINRPHSQVDHCKESECRALLVHPDRADSAMESNITRRQWKAKRWGDRRCTTCSVKHAALHASLRRDAVPRSSFDPSSEGSKTEKTETEMVELMPDLRGDLDSDRPCDTLDSLE